MKAICNALCDGLLTCPPDVYQMLPPLMQTINDQTGITLPEWQFGRLNNQMSEIEKNKEISKVNGDI